MELIRIKNEELERYEAVLMRRDAFRKEAEQIHMQYLSVFGDLMSEVFKQKIECIKKKKMIAYCQRKINQGKMIDMYSLNEYIDLEMAEYRIELDQMIQTIDALKKSGTVTESELRKIKQLYRGIVKMIHPDVRPGFDEDEMIRTFWLDTVIAYRHNDLSKLEELDVMIKAYLQDRNIDVGEIVVENIKEKIEEAEKEITQIISTDPYQYRFILEDPNAVKEKNEELKEELRSFRDYSEQLDSVLAEFDIKEMYA